MSYNYIAKDSKNVNEINCQYSDDFSSMSKKKFIRGDLDNNHIKYDGIKQILSVILFGSAYLFSIITVLYLVKDTKKKLLGKDTTTAVSPYDKVKQFIQNNPKKTIAGCGAMVAAAGWLYKHMKSQSDKSNVTTSADSTNIKSNNIKTTDKSSTPDKTSDDNNLSENGPTIMGRVISFALGGIAGIATLIIENYFFTPAGNITTGYTPSRIGENVAITENPTQLISPRNAAASTTQTGSSPSNNISASSGSAQYPANCEVYDISGTGASNALGSRSASSSVVQSPRRCPVYSISTQTSTDILNDSMINRLFGNHLSILQ